jgi:glycosyltransferase involved in cell wall biosynthesis
MKILMLADVFFPDTIGGAGRVIYHIAWELGKKGHEIHIITRNDDGKWPSHQKLKSNLFIHRFNTPSEESLSLLLSEIKNSYSLAHNLAREMEFDLLSSHQSLAAIGPLMVSSLRRIPAVHYFNSPWHEEFLIKNQADVEKPGMKTKLIAFLMKRVERQVISKAEKVIVMSQYMADKISEIHSFSTDKMVIIPGGVDLQGFSLPIDGKASTKAAVKFPLDKTLFLTVRNLVPRMGLEPLIEAFNNSPLLKEKGLLLIAGRGPLEKKLHKMVARFDLNQSIRFLGRVPEEDLPRIYQAADFFVLPTRKLEGFGLVILEAMACGTPVLGTPVGAIPELLGPFDQNLLFDGTGWQDLKRKLEEVIEEPERFKFEPEACRNFVEENFSWSRVADEFEQVVNKLIETEG